MTNITALAIVCGSIILAVGVGMIACFLFWAVRSIEITAEDEHEALLMAGENARRYFEEKEREK